MTTTYANQRFQCMFHTYYIWCGYCVLSEASLDLFGWPIVGGGYYPVEVLDFNESLRISLEKFQSLVIVQGDYSI